MSTILSHLLRPYRAFESRRDDAVWPQYAAMNLFVYGCLLAPEVLERVTGRSFRSEEGVLHGYMGLRLKRSPDAAQGKRI